MANSKTGGSDDTDASGKYLLISVPEFAEDPITPGKLMTSYLRLGAASTSWRDDPGGELAANIALSGPPGASLSPAQVEVDIQGDEGDARPVFVDDTRGREDCPEPHQLSVDERVKQSHVLHTRGGWRDHSDGNRITTTYGDKIEVIRGNYKMVVLGRQDDPNAAAGWDASGQHLQDFASTKPGASVRVEWTEDHGGVWHLQNTTEGVVQSSNYAGDFYNYSWGKRHETTIGSEKPVERLPDPDGRPRGNPHIINKTWAEQIESYIGSPAWRIPSVQKGMHATTAGLVLDLGSLAATLNVDDIDMTMNVKTANVHMNIGAANMVVPIGAANMVMEVGALQVTAGIGVMGANMSLGSVNMAMMVDVMSAVMALNTINMAMVFNQMNAIMFSPQIAMFLGPMLSLGAMMRNEYAMQQQTTASSVTHAAGNYSVNSSKVSLGMG